MRLGNSNGNNRGKKYRLRSNTDNQQPTEQNRAKADRFATWFGNYHASILTELRQKDIYNDDTINETFLKMYDSILLKGLDIDNFRAYYMRAYFTNLIQGNIREGRFSSISPYFDQEDSKQYNPQVDIEQKRLEEDIFTYVYDKYKTSEFELFKMYMCLKPAVNYGTLSEITNIKTHRIQFIISKIKKDLCGNKNFTIRRMALVG